MKWKKQLDISRVAFIAVIQLFCQQLVQEQNNARSFQLSVVQVLAHK